MPRSILQLRTRRDLRKVLGDGESPAWRVGRKAAQRVTRVRIVNFDGTQMIEGEFDRGSERQPDGRLIVRFLNGRLADCHVAFDSQNPVRYPAD